MARKITISYGEPEKKEETISVDDARIYVSVLSKHQIQMDDRICFHLVPRDNVVMAHVVAVHDHVPPSSVEKNKTVLLDLKPIIKPPEQPIIYEATYPCEDDTFFERAPFSENSKNEEDASSSSKHHDMKGLPVLNGIQTSGALPTTPAQNRNVVTSAGVPKLPPPVQNCLMLAPKQEFVTLDPAPIKLRPLPPPHWSRQNPPLVPIPRPQIPPIANISSIESPVQETSSAPAPSRQLVLTTAPPTPAAQTKASVLNGLHKADRQKAISNLVASPSSSSSSSKEPHHRIGYASTMYVKNAAKQLQGITTILDAEIKQLFDNCIKTLRRPPIANCLDENLCYAMFDYALDAIKHSDLQKFTGLLTEILFDFAVMDVAYMPKVSRKRTDKLSEAKPSHKRQLNAITMQAFSYLIRYYTCFIDPKASKFDEFIATTRDSFNAIVDRRIKKARQQNRNVYVADTYKHLPVDIWNKHIPPFNVKNAFAASSA